MSVSLGNGMAGMGQGVVMGFQKERLSVVWNESKYGFKLHLDNKCIT